MKNPKIGDITRGKDIGKTDQAFMWAACISCGKERWISRWFFYKKKNSTGCCRRCSSMERLRKIPRPLGRDNPRWKGGRHVDGFGYIVVWVHPDSPFYKMTGLRLNYLREHRLVMAQHLGRCLHSWEIVHHINGDKQDNKISNLQISNHRDHAALTKMNAEIARLKVLLFCLLPLIDSNKILCSISKKGSE